MDKKYLKIIIILHKSVIRYVKKAGSIRDCQHFN